MVQQSARASEASSAAELTAELTEQSSAAIELGDLFIDRATVQIAQIALPNRHLATVELRAGELRAGDDTPPTGWTWTSTSPRLPDPGAVRRTSRRSGSTSPRR